MADPKEGVHLQGELADVRWDGDEVHAMDWIFDRLGRDPHWYGTLDDDAAIGEERGLRHYTHKGWAIFFRWGNQPNGLYVYAVGRHPGDNLKQYKLYTYESGNKLKNYTF